MTLAFVILLVGYGCSVSYDAGTAVLSIGISECMSLDWWVNVSGKGNSFLLSITTFKFLVVNSNPEDFFILKKAVTSVTKSFFLIPQILTYTPEKY